MAILYSRDDQRRLILVTTIGYVAPEDLLEVVERQAAEGTWRYRTVYDSSAGVNTPKREDLRRLVMRIGQLTAKHGPRGPVALVADSASLSKMAQVYQRLVELTGMDFHMFATLEEAEVWLEEEYQP